MRRILFAIVIAAAACRGTEDDPAVARSSAGLASLFDLSGFATVIWPTTGQPVGHAALLSPDIVLTGPWIGVDLLHATVTFEEQGVTSRATVTSVAQVGVFLVARVSPAFPVVGPSDVYAVAQAPSVPANFFCALDPALDFFTKVPVDASFGVSGVTTGSGGLCSQELDQTAIQGGVVFTGGLFHFEAFRATDITWIESALDCESQIPGLPPATVSQVCAENACFVSFIACNGACPPLPPPPPDLGRTCSIPCNGHRSYGTIDCDSACSAVCCPGSLCF